MQSSSNNNLASVRLVLFALFCSGVAAIINQIVWQRALKVYLAGSEAISSMIVVLVFMLGLGLGSYHIGRAARRIRNPLRMLGLVEVALFVLNLVICGILTLSISATAITMQQAAFRMGIPLRVLYAVVSALVLIVPCYLMGMTMPLVSEASQRQLKVRNTGFLTTLFVLNTLGAVGGAFLSGFMLLPSVGQRNSLIIAFGLNLLAGLVIFAVRASREAAPTETLETDEAAPVEKAGRIRRADVYGFLLGFWALAYEMYLLRIGAIAFEPVPTTFSKILGLYLLCWSLGMFLAPRIKLSFSQTLVLSGVFILIVPHYLYYTAISSTALLVIMLLPCVFFGLSFGRIVIDTTKNWGNDIGSFYFMNTIGSCLGILLTVLVGYRTHPMFLAWVIAVAYLLMALWASADARSAAGRISRPILLAGGLVAALWAILAAPMAGTAAATFEPGGPNRAYFGPDGVVQVRNGKQMIWDGLWHSDLSDGDHVDTNNWLLGSVPLMAHEGGEDLDCLVVGLGTGITAATLASYPAVSSVHVYEINKSLQDLLMEFPDGTLNVATDPKVDIDWQDGRIGLILNPRRYDIITQQPTYLKQAGSSMLLSQEYMELVKNRLAPGGIFCVYCNSLGNKAQAAVVRKAASEVFPYYESAGNGYMLLLSDEPITFTEEKVRARIAGLPVGSVARREAEEYGAEGFASYFDSEKLDWTSSPYAVTDDHPIVEYPEWASRLVPVARRGR